MTFNHLVFNYVNDTYGEQYFNEKELDVLREFLKGKSNMEIGKALSFTEGTAKFYFTGIFISFRKIFKNPKIRRIEIYTCLLEEMFSKGLISVDDRELE